MTARSFCVRLVFTATLALLAPCLQAQEGLKGALSRPKFHRPIGTGESGNCGLRRRQDARWRGSPEYRCPALAKRFQNRTSLYQPSDHGTHFSVQSMFSSCASLHGHADLLSATVWRNTSIGLITPATRRVPSEVSTGSTSSSSRSIAAMASERGWSTVTPRGS